MRRPLAAVVLGVILILVPTHLQAQRNSWRVTTPSPTAASLGKFGDIPVSLYSGTPDITVPLFTAKGRTLELPITLRYHAGGIKAEEIGSWVGIGWTLEAGGTITRTVRGLVDEELDHGYYYTGTTWYIGTNWQQPSDVILNNLRNENIDGEPDQFFFNFAGRSGKFVLGPVGASGPIEYRAIPHQKLRIQPTLTTEGITQWTITTEDGTIYVFGMPERTTDWTVTSSTDESSHTGESYTSSWHLTSITAPGGDVMTLQYQQYTARHVLGLSREQFSYVQAIPEQPCGAVGGLFDVAQDNEILSARPWRILTAAHTITFTPGADARQDDGPVSGSEPRLDNITVATPAGTELRKFQFVQDYSTGRLTLRSVAEQNRNGASLPPHTFSYDPMPLPGRGSFATDHWGFYNGRTTNTTPIPLLVSPYGHMLQGADRGPDTAYARAGVLTKITYPTGGFTEFTYEPNDYGSVAGSYVTGVIDGQEQTRWAQAGPSAEEVTEQFTVVGLHPADTILVKLEFWQTPTGCAGMDWPPCPMTQLGNTGGWQTNGQWQLYLTPGTYTLRAVTLDTNQEANITATWRNRYPHPGRIGAGLRVAKIASSDAMNPSNVTIRRYKYTLAADPTHSSGDISAEPQYAYQYSSQSCSYYSRSSMSKAPLGEGPVVGYREVTVWHGTNGEFGKTRHAFRSTATVADPPPQGVWPFSQRTSYEWMRGQEVEAIEFDAADRWQQRVASTYAFPTDATTSRSFRGISINSFSTGPIESIYYYTLFEVISAWAYQDSDTTYTYDEAGTNSIASAKTYAYENPAHLQLTQLTETNSDGTKRITRMKYPADYAPGSPPAGSEADAIRLMQGAAHMHSPVVERWVVQLNGSSAKVVQADVTTFKEFATGKVLPYQHFILNAPSPVP